MSGDAASLSCPVCLHNGVFNCAVSLRDRLIYVSTNKIACPVCQEEICGLDKLTIHLFSHVKLISKRECSGNGSKLKKGDHETINRTVEATQLKKQRPTTGVKNRTACSGNAQIKFVKIYPKLPVISLTTMPVIQTTVKTPTSFSPPANTTCLQTLKSEQTPLQLESACNICGLQFVDTNILKMHLCLIHNNENTKHDVTRYNCHICPKSFKMRGSLMVHLRVAHYGFSNESSVNNNRDKKVLEEKSHNNGVEKLVALDRSDNKQWQCDVCQKCFTTKYFLKKHKRLHTGETPYACTQCNKTFTFQQSYHKHLLYHNDEKPHSCSYCGRAFKELSTLHNHQRIHTGEKPFSCETCGKCFRQRVSYLVHRRIHTGAMPYKCTACEKSFRYKVSQRTHKCQAQPPGTVIRQTGDLVEKLKKKNVENSTQPTEYEEQSKQSINYSDISKANAELALIGAKLSLEDTETESFSFIDEVFNENNETKHRGTSSISKIVNSNDNELFGSNIEDMIEIGCLENAPSPSDILKKLCLSKEDDCNVWDMKANKT